MEEDRKRRVLLIAIQWKLRGAIGGMSQRFVMYATRAYDRGHDVQCLTSWSMANHLGSVGHPALICIEDRKFRLFHAARVACLVGFKIVKGQYDRVHFAGGGKIGEILLFLASKMGVEVSCTFASRTLEMASYDNEASRTKWIGILNIADKIDVLNPGHDLNQWLEKISVSECSFPSRLVGKEIGLRPKIPLMVFSGALVANKNPLLAIRIAEAIRASGINAKLVVFGDGALRAECEALARTINERYGLAVISFGAPDQYFDALRKAALFLSLQEYDNYPSQSLMEAMAYGCRCVCTLEGDTSLMFPSLSDENVLVDSRSADMFLEGCARLINRRDASVENSEHISLFHNIGKFSVYFDAFLGFDKFAGTSVSIGGD